MPQYPSRIKDFRRWASDKVDKGRVTDSVTGSRTSQTRRKQRRRRAKRRSRREEE